MRPHVDVTSPPRRRLHRALGGAIAAVVLTTALTACGDDDTESPDASSTASESSASSESPSESPSPSPSTSDTPSPSPSESRSEPAGPTLEVEVEGDEVEPVAARVDLGVGERLTITVEADRAGELHVHSDPERTFTFGPGTERFRLTLDTPGSVDVEEHGADALVARILVR